MYRDELAAARARIEALEKELAEVRARLELHENPQASHQELVRARAAAKNEYDAAGAARSGSAAMVGLLGVVGTLIFTVLIASLGAAGHPFNAFVLGASMTFVGLGLVMALYSPRVRAARDALVESERALDAETAAIRVRIAHDVAHGSNVAVVESEREETERQRHAASE